MPSEEAQLLSRQGRDDYIFNYLASPDIFDVRCALIMSEKSGHFINFSLLHEAFFYRTYILRIHLNHDGFAMQLLRDDECGSGSGKRIESYITRIRGRQNNSGQQ